MAQVQPIDIIAPGARGLNTAKGSILLPPLWATTALNAVINRAGRIASRKGWVDQTTTGITGDKQIDVIHEYLNKAGTSEIITTADNKIYKNITDFSDAGNDITSSTAPSADHWQFINFNDKVLGFQRGEVPIARTTSDFADASYTGTGPDGNCAVAAFGRVWAADADLQTVRYSALLDDTDYSLASGGGTLDMSSIWTNGTDRIVAIAAVGSNLVVFGENHIVLWADGSGSELGLSVFNLAVVDTIEGTGCIARDSVQATGEGDLLYLSRHGLQSLGRTIQSRNNPTRSLSRNVREDFALDVKTQRDADGEMDQVRSTYSPEEGLYILNLPVVDRQYVFDLNHEFQDEDGFNVFPVTTWEMGGSIVGMTTTSHGALYFGSAGIVGLYSGSNDGTEGYPFKFQTGWLDFAELNHRLKMVKEIIASVVVSAADVKWTWEFDFSGSILSRTVTYSTGGAEFNEAEYSIGEFSGGTQVQRKLIAAYGEGQFLRLGCESTISGAPVIVQHMSVAAKIGRLVT